MPRASLLTNGLDGVASASPTIARMLKELYQLDDVLQEAHQDAQRDDENGERVVTAYERFLRYRESFVAQLEKDKLAVPWQLRMRIDDIELTLRQRKEKQETIKQTKSKKASPTGSPTSKGGSSSTSPASTATGTTVVEEDDSEKEDPLLLLKAMILPSVFLAVIAAAVYFVATLAQ